MKKKPWSLRAKSNQSVETIFVKNTWDHAKCIANGRLLKVMSLYGSLALLILSIWSSLKRWIDGRDDPNAPNFWEDSFPLLGIGLCLIVLWCVVGIFISLIGKSALKPKLIPIRYQRCPKCFYDLSGRPHDDETCPECGICAPRRECVRLWCRLMRAKL